MMDNNISFPTDKTLIDFFLEQVERTPENIAIDFEEEALTYKELNERSNQLAHYLKSFGVKEVDLVPICVRGNHNTFITSPNEKHFATVFQEVIDREINQ